MDLNLADRIRERAYYLWMAGGRREGDAEQHWLTAEREILQPHDSAPETSKAMPPAKRAIAKKATRPLRRTASRVVAPLVN